MRKHRPELAKHFIFITGGVIGELAPEVAAFGLPVLSKPFSVRELRAALSRLLPPA